MTLVELARKLRPFVVKASQHLDNADALEAKELFDKFENEMTVTGGHRYRYGDDLYRCILPDGSTRKCDPGWNPESAPSLFSKVLPGQDGTPIGEWQRPISTNGYMTGDKCIFGGLVHESVIDNNVWSPAEYPAGWKVVPE